MTRQQSVSEAVRLTLPLTEFERTFYYMTAHNHYNAGCPDLSLQVLLDLPPPENDSNSVSVRGGGGVLLFEQVQCR